MPVVLQDRSGRLLHVGDHVQVIVNLEHVKALCGVIWEDSLESVVGQQGVVLKLDKRDLTVRVRFPVQPSSDGTTNQWWLPAFALEPPGVVDVGLSSQESISIQLADRLFEDDNFKDVTFRLEDGEERAHRCVLAASSRVFSGMLNAPMSEAQTGLVSLPDVRRATMRVFLRLLYTGHVDPRDWQAPASGKLPLEMLMRIVELAKKYMVDGVMQCAIEATKARLSKAADEPRAFEEILRMAIAVDVGAVRMAALDMAKSSRKVQAMYQSQKFCPEVQTELQAIWPPQYQPMKRARLE